MPVSDLLRDPVWATVLGLAAIFVALFIPILQRRRKAINWRLVSQTPLLEIKSKLPRSLEIRYSGQPVDSADVIHLRLENAGNSSIRPEDFIRPLRITFGDEAQPLTFEIEQPEQLGATGNIEKKCVTVAPLLLNHGDQFDIKVLVAGNIDQIRVDARIDGIKEIREVGERGGRVRHTLSLVGFVLMVLVGMFVAVGVSFLFPSPWNLLTLGALMLIAITWVAWTSYSGQ